MPSVNIAYSNTIFDQQNVLNQMQDSLHDWQLSANHIIRKYRKGNVENLFLNLNFI